MRLAELLLFCCFRYLKFYRHVIMCFESFNNVLTVRFGFDSYSKFGVENVYFIRTSSVVIIVSVNFLYLNILYFKFLYNDEIRV